MPIVTGLSQENSIQEDMEGSPFTFYLTGSRYFGTENFNSDTDYFTSDNSGIREWLVNKGFHKNTVSRYVDMLTTEVWSNFALPVDVQICKDVEKKVNIQAVMKALGMLYPTKEMWNFAYVLLSK